MAVRNDATSKLILKVVLSTAPDGTETYGKRVIQHLNPALTDEQVLALGTKLSTLQTSTLNAVLRQDAASLSA